MSTVRGGFAAFMLVALVLLTIFWTAPTLGAETASKTVVLVARPELKDPIYEETILIAKPIGNGQHMGFILNKPTQFSLADAFPKHKTPIGKHDALYLGGPADVNLMFALVAGHGNPGSGSMQLAPDLYLAFTAKTVDQLIDTASDHARVFAGAVIWRPGELNAELERGLWYVLEPEPELVLPKKTEGLWDTLVQRAELKEKGI